MKSDPVKTVKKGLLTKDPDRAEVNLHRRLSTWSRSEPKISHDHMARYSRMISSAGR